jgi:hypothetical protein
MRRQCPTREGTQAQLSQHCNKVRKNNEPFSGGEGFHQVRPSSAVGTTNQDYVIFVIAGKLLNTRIVYL